MNTLFADRLTNLQIAGNTVRLEFSVLEVVPGQTMDNARMTPGHVLVMPIEGFVQAFNGQEAVVKQLIDQGVLKRNETAQQAQA
jgi:hypothetical protein